MGRVWFVTFNHAWSEIQRPLKHWLLSPLKTYKCRVLSVWSLILQQNQIILLASGKYL